MDDSLTTIEAAEAAGNADLREHANPRVKGSFETETPGWAPGQLLPINLPAQGITNTFVVQKVTITPFSDTLWTWKIEYGGRLIGIADFLKAMLSAQQKKKLGDTAILHKFAYGADKTAITDELEAIYRTPPWVCGDAICGFVMCARVQLPPIGTTLEDCTWKQIKDISDAGEASNYFNIGDEISITLSTDEVLTLQIYDFDHDVISGARQGGDYFRNETSNGGPTTNECL